MGDMKQCDFFLLRYVPDAVKEEFVNFGVVLLERDPQFAEVRLYPRLVARALFRSAGRH